MTKNTLVLDEMPKLFWEIVADNNMQDYFSTEKLLFSESIEVIILRTKSAISESTFKCFPNLKTVIRAGSGYDNIDIDSALSYGVEVQNTPDANILCAYEHTIGLIFSLIKNHKYMNNSVLTNNWKTNIPNNMEISDLNVLIVGLGRIGSRVAEALHFLGANVRYYDPYVVSDKFQQCSDYLQAMQWCNMVTYHCPLYSKTKHMFNKDILSQIKNKPYIVNVARGGVVDIDAIRKGLEQDIISGAALDVYENEPWKYEGWEDSHRLILSPHVGAFTKAAKDRLSKDCYTAWKNFTFEKKIAYPVTIWR
jgi:D-3-phosphoglycerate dehydrogenase